MFYFRKNRALAVSCVLALTASSAAAQSGAWLIFPDDPVESLFECGVVNAGVEDLLVIDDTSDLETIDGFVVPGSFVDVLSPVEMSTFIDDEDTEAWVVADVFIDNTPFGFLAFTDDGDDLRSLWWLRETQGVFRGVELFEDTLEPFVANLIPFNVANASCDACELLIGSPFCGCVNDLDCVDGDPCTDDICDANGDCVYVDVCPDEPRRRGGGTPQVSFSFCGSGASLAMSFTFVGLLMATLVRRRW